MHILKAKSPKTIVIQYLILEDFEFLQIMETNLVGAKQPPTRLVVGRSPFTGACLREWRRLRWTSEVISITPQYNQRIVT